MGNQVSLIPKVSYEDLQMVVYRNLNVQHSTLIINTLPPSLQHCLIKTTVDIRFEERVVNTFIQKNPNIMIIVYGKNSNDITILHKYEQLVKLGFTNVHIYTGGIFEWMLLHEIYGKDLFKITRYEIDILRYRPKSVLLARMAGGGDGTGIGDKDDFGGYLEDGFSSPSSSGMAAGRGGDDDAERDIRINIPQQNANANANVNANANANESGNLFTTGIKWLFGS
jgi:Rhodanese-like domain